MYIVWKHNGSYEGWDQVGHVRDFDEAILLWKETLGSGYSFDNVIITEEVPLNIGDARQKATGINFYAHALSDGFHPTTEVDTKKTV